MSAHERYQYLVGEIGISRDEYLYELQYWEILLIVRGYGQRHRDMWSAIRWQTFSLMCVSADLKKAGIYSPTDLIPFPWDKSDSDGAGGLTQDDIAELQRQMKEYNSQLGHD